VHVFICFIVNIKKKKLIIAAFNISLNQLKERFMVKVKLQTQMFSQQGGGVFILQTSILLIVFTLGQI